MSLKRGCEWEWVVSGHNHVLNMNVVSGVLLGLFLHPATLSWLQAAVLQSHWAEQDSEIWMIEIFTTSCVRVWWDGDMHHLVNQPVTPEIDWEKILCQETQNKKPKRKLKAVESYVKKIKSCTLRTWGSNSWAETTQRGRVRQDHISNWEEGS